MAQHDYDLANQTRSSFRSDLNSALAAIVSNNSGATEPSVPFAYQWWADTTTGKLKLRNAANTAWIEIGTLATTNLGLALVGGVNTQTFSVADATAINHAISAQQLQKQSLTAFTTAGTSTAYTITTLGTPIALTTGERWRIKFNQTAGASPTLNRDAKGAKALKLYNSAGVKVAASATSIIANMLTDVEYDGTDYVILDALPPTVSVPVRQTVLSGPVDSSGYAAFGGATGSTTVTASGTLTVTAADGITNHVATVTNPSWTGLSTNGTMYLYMDISAGVSSTASSTLAPIYQWGGTPATTSGLLTFNIQEMKGYLGNGSSAPQAYRVCVGEVAVAGGVVTSITWYAPMGRYMSTATSLAYQTTYSFTHNIGVVPAHLDMDAWIRDTTNGNMIPYHIDASYDSTANFNNFAMATSNTERNVFKVRTSNAWLLSYLDSGGTYRQYNTGAELIVRMKRGW